MTEIASINNQVFRTLSSPLIITEDEEIILDLTKSQEVLITFDHITMNESGVKSVRLKIADEKIRFARYRHTHFWDRVRNAFIGDNY